MSQSVKYRRLGQNVQGLCVALVCCFFVYELMNDSEVKFVYFSDDIVHYTILPVLRDKIRITRCFLSEI